MALLTSLTGKLTGKTPDDISRQNIRQTAIEIVLEQVTARPYENAFEDYPVQALLCHSSSQE
jgi:hypothetical protein